MNFDIREDNILAIKNTEKETKLYTHTLSGKKISHPDFQLPVLHKKKIKIVNWKELGNKMQIFVSLPDRNQGKQDTKNKISTQEYNLDSSSFEYAFDLFQGFNEKTGETYSFLYKVNTQKIKTITPLLNSQNIKLENIGGVFTKKVNTKRTQRITISELDKLSFLFGLFSIYGSFQKKGETIVGAKIFIPLFGQYLQQKNFFVQIINDLGKQSYFINSSIQETNDGEILQLSITDYEILILFVKWYQSVEKNKEISKLIELDKATNLLKNSFEEYAIDGNMEILNHMKLISKE